MQIEHLRYFIALDTFQSINKTSRELGTTPQNVSRILKNLETEMDADLFFRTADGVTLTQTGTDFLQFAKATVYHFDKLQADIHYRKTQQNQHKDVVLFSSNVVNEIILNDILVAFSQEYPEIFVNNMIVDWKEGYQKISAMPSALAFLAYWPEKNFLEGFDFVPALQSHNVAIMSKTHPLAQNSYVTIPQLLDHKLIILTQNHVADTEVVVLLEQYLPTRKVSLTGSGNLRACYRLAANGEYICPGSIESFLHQEEYLRENLITLPIIDFPLTTHALIKHKHLPKDSAQHLLFSFILDYLQNNPVT